MIVIFEGILFENSNELLIILYWNLSSQECSQSFGAINPNFQNLMGEIFDNCVLTLANIEFFVKIFHEKSDSSSAI